MDDTVRWNLSTKYDAYNKGWITCTHLVGFQFQYGKRVVLFVVRLTNETFAAFPGRVLKKKKKFYFEIFGRFDTLASRLAFSFRAISKFGQHVSPTCKNKTFYGHHDDNSAVVVLNDLLVLFPIVVKPLGKLHISVRYL